MKDLSKKIQETSHSGAFLEVFEDEGVFYVRKSTDTDIERSYKAIQKQQEFRQILTPAFRIKSVPVIDVSKGDSMLVFTMPYVDGIGGEQLAIKVTSALAKNIKLSLDSYLVQSLSKASDCVYPIELVKCKLNRIEQQMLGKSQWFPNFQEHVACFRKYCSTDLIIPIGTCHGDLTLSNIKITEDGDLYLFDFLECEINSPLQDAVKLLQDFKYGWSYRKEKESVRLKAAIFGRFVCPDVISEFERIYAYQMMVIEILTIFRIAPYIAENDLKTILWFNETITKSIRSIRGSPCTH